MVAASPASTSGTGGATGARRRRAASQAAGSAARKPIMNGHQHHRAARIDRRDGADERRGARDRVAQHPAHGLDRRHQAGPGSRSAPSAPSGANTTSAPERVPPAALGSRRATRARRDQEHHRHQPGDEVAARPKVSSRIDRISAISTRTTSASTSASPRSAARAHRMPRARSSLEPRQVRAPRSRAGVRCRAAVGSSSLSARTTIQSAPRSNRPAAASSCTRSRAAPVTCTTSPVPRDRQRPRRAACAR